MDRIESSKGYFLAERQHLQQHLLHVMWIVGWAGIVKHSVCWMQKFGEGLVCKHQVRANPAQPAQSRISHREKKSVRGSLTFLLFRWSINIKHNFIKVIKCDERCICIYYLVIICANACIYVYMYVYICLLCICICIYVYACIFMYPYISD